MPGLLGGIFAVSNLDLGANCSVAKIDVPVSINVNISRISYFHKAIILWGYCLSSLAFGLGR